MIRSVVRAANNTDWSSSKATCDQRSVAVGIRILIFNLPALVVASAMPGIDDDVTFIDIILVAAGDDDRLGAGRLGAYDPALERPVYARTCQGSTVDEGRARFDAGESADDLLG